jgi:hypothetical protein
MDRYEYIIASIPKYINGYTTKMMSMNMDSISMIADTLGGIFFMALPIGYFLTIRFTRRGEIELNTLFLQEIAEQSRVPLM